MSEILGSIFLGAKRRVLQDESPLTHPSTSATLTETETSHSKRTFKNILMCDMIFWLGKSATLAAVRL